MNDKTYNISIQQIQIFLKAVELNNFTQVAAAFNYTPSMISKTIAAMEEELELQLFIRKPHELAPTPAARMLAGDWRHFARSFENSVQKAQAYQSGRSERIVLGFVDSSDEVDRIIHNAIESYGTQHPEMRLIAEKHDMHRAMELINCGMLDLAITDAIEIPYLTEHRLPWEKLCDTNIALYIPERNPLFRKEHLSIEDLKDSELVALDPLMHPSYSEWLNSLCADHGFVPRITQTYRTVRSLLFSLRLNSAAFIGNSITSDWQDNALRQVLLPETSFSLIVWRDGADPGILAFRDYLIGTYRKIYSPG